MAYLPPNAGRMNVTFGGNTAGAAATVSTGTLGLHGGNNVTLSQNGNNITVSAATALTSQSNQAMSGSNGSFAFQTATFGSSNGMHFYTTNGSMVGSYTVPTQSVQNLSFSAGGNTSLTSTGTFGANSMWLNGLGAASVGFSSSSMFVSAPATSGLSATGAVSISSNGGTISIGAPVQTVQTVGFYATGANTTGQSSSNTFDARSMNISAQGGLYAGMSGNTIHLSAATTYAASNHSHGNPTLNLTNLSGTTASNSNGLTLSLSAAAPGAGGGAAFSAGTQSVNTGTVNFANSNGISFGMSGSNQITASYTVPTQSAQTIGIYATGANTTGQSSSNTLDARNFSISAQGGLYAGMSGNTLQLSAATTYAASNHSHGNPTLALTNISGTTASASNGLTLSLSAAAPGAGGGIALANSQTAFTSGTVSLNVSAGAMTIGSSVNGASQSFNFAVPATSSLSATGAVSIETNGSTISIGVPIETNNFYQNMDRGTTAALATANGTLMLQRLNQENDKFAANLTANTMLLNMSGSVTATASSSAHSFFVSVGIYSDYGNSLNLINSATSSWALAANTSNSAYYHGPRWLSFVSSQWSSAPNFSYDGEYVFGVIFRSSNLAIPMSYIGQNYMLSAQRSGYFGVATTTGNTSMPQGNYWNAMYTVSTTALPGFISSNQVNRNNATAIFMPHIILNNRYSVF